MCTKVCTISRTAETISVPRPPWAPREVQAGIGIDKSFLQLALLQEGIVSPTWTPRLSR